MQDFALQKKLIIGGLALLLAADVAFAYFTMRLSGSREVRQQTLATQARQLALVKADVARATDIQKRTPDVLKELDEFEGSLLPSSKGYSVVTQEINEFAKETHILIEDVKFQQKEVSGRDLTELGLVVSINGDYGGIVQFLNRLQRSKSVYIIDGLEVEPNTGQGPAGQLKLSLHLRTYFRKA
jgi:type IV pilus assembly protein PilO